MTSVAAVVTLGVVSVTLCVLLVQRSREWRDAAAHSRWFWVASVLRAGLVAALGPPLLGPASGPRGGWPAGSGAECCRRPCPLIWSACAARCVVDGSRCGRPWPSTVARTHSVAGPGRRRPLSPAQGLIG